jgi:membrane protease YdiL (CAAX protease family)
LITASPAATLTVASPDNPLDPVPAEPDESSLAQHSSPAPLPASTPENLPSLPRRVPSEDPPWTLVEVVVLAVATVFTVFVSLLMVSALTHRVLLPRVPWMDIAKRPEVVVASQALAYGVVLFFMYWLAAQHGGQAKETLRWNWPQNWAIFLWSGILLSVGLQLFAHFLPMPKTLPIDQFFETRREAWLLSIFGVTLAPLVEELFFRGFLYPALARHVKVPAAVVITGVAFGAIHGSQLSNSWGPVLVIVIVGIVLTAVRAYTKSVGSTVLMHIGYNLTITVALYYTTDAFRHLDKLRQ